MDDERPVSPFGGKSRIVARFHTQELARRYMEKCGADISFSLDGIEFAELYECELTGYKFWYPFELAGTREFYAALESNWPNYYRADRWEYETARKFLQPGHECLEIGCGRGYFLRSIESIVETARGLEFNEQAISGVVCKSPVVNESLEAHAPKTKQHYDCVVSFQVLEHMPDPMDFLENCKTCLKKDGYLILSLPNDDNVIHRDMQDAFNFPPHHMGSYSPRVLREVGKLIGMELVHVICAPPDWPGIRVTRTVADHYIWRFFSRLVRLVGLHLLTALKEPGHTMLVVYKSRG